MGAGAGRHHHHRCATADWVELLGLELEPTGCSRPLSNMSCSKE